MFNNAVVRRRTIITGALLSTAGLALSACSGTTVNIPGADGSSTASAGNDAVVGSAPVAASDLIVSGSTMEKIKQRGKLIVATALDAPLVSQQDPSDPQKVNGFDADLAKMLAVYITGKPNVEWVPSASETREALLANGTVDVVFSTYTITTKRAEQVDFAGPYFMSGLAVAVKADNNTIKGIDDLGGKNVIVQTGTPSVSEVPAKQPSAKIMPFATTPQGVQALTQGRGDAYVQDYVLLASQSASNKDIKVVGAPFTAEPYGIGLKHNDAAFKTFVNNWLTVIEKKGLWTQVWKNTLGSVGDSPAPTPPAIGSVPGS
ncbi:glutamate ABC transporter substrate-binding protein [Arthrobacter sp. A2-55]|uniref:glutamate ABC transporter substrate-binding protein n=1 Tax=Arthrobacter sp. A2-55 TaxID=2897337 RepID=UPI0021CDE81C|nr:glutamate ABC transporter substrate-binding protein [Arthrobacter sp. A2-55]MCU6481949.1 glutamate ABC transporter substrate-binding protein [Arthrobacter sp. A2-55]